MVGMLVLLFVAACLAADHVAHGRSPAARPS